MVVTMDVVEREGVEMVTPPSSSSMMMMITVDVVHDPDHVVDPMVARC